MMPILKYLKVEIEFGICTITKSNLSSFCSHSFPIEQSEDFSFIVLESRLKAASDLAGEEIVLKINGDFIELNVGNIKSKFNNGTSTVEDFVKIPTFNDKTIRFTPEIIASFDIAKLYVQR